MFRLLQLDKNINGYKDQDKQIKGGPYKRNLLCETLNTAEYQTF